MTADATSTDLAQRALQEAKRLYGAGRRGEAIDRLREACRCWPSHARIRTQLGWWLWEARDYYEQFGLLSPHAGQSEIGPAEFRRWFAAGLYSGRLTEPGDWLHMVSQCTLPDAGRERVAMLALSAFGGGASVPGGMLPLSDEALDDCLRYALALASRESVRALAYVASLRALDARAGAKCGIALLQEVAADGRPVCLSTLREFGEALVHGEPEAKVFSDLLAIADAPQEFHDILTDVVERVRDLDARATCALTVVELLHSRNDPARARSTLVGIETGRLRPGGRQRYQRLAEVLAVPVPDSFAPVAQILPDDVFEDGLIRHYRFGRERCVIWFGGVTPSGETHRQQILLAHWRERGISVLTVHDHRRFASLGGFGRHFGNRPAAEAVLAEVIAGLGYRQIVTSGASLAGASAFLYAVRLNAAGVLMFSGMTHLPKIEDIARNFGLLILHRLRNEFSIDFDDALVLLAAHPRPELVVHAHFGSGMEVDRKQAEHIAHLPNAVLFGRDHDSHDSLSWLRAQDELGRAIYRFAADLPPATP